MGCTQSSIENEETVIRCKDRKHFMERSQTSRNKFAAAHVSTAVSLKNIGAALSDFAPGEMTQIPHSMSMPVSSGIGTSSTFGGAGLSSQRGTGNYLFPPPPLPPQFNNSPLQRAATMPAEFPVPGPGLKGSDLIIEEENEENDASNFKRRNRNRREKQKTIEEGLDFFHEMAENEDHELDMNGESAVTGVPQQTATSMIVKRVQQGSSSNLSLTQIFLELDDCFLKASESAHEVSRMLEATRLHYHSNFADERGNMNHSERVMRVITWNRSFKGLSNGTDNQKDDFDSEENETHASVLDKMLAWEKKLYEEVKAGEQMKVEYQKKVNSLNKLKKNGSNTDALERMKAAVSHLHTRYIVDIQAMDCTVAEINRLRDEQLYLKLVALVDGMAAMWGMIRAHHLRQSKIVESLKLLDASSCPKETSDHHHDRTRQLGGVAQEWHTNFCELMTYQKDHISALNSWLKLNLIPIDINSKEKALSPERTAQIRARPILQLLSAWHDCLLKLPDEPAKAAINNFAAVVKTIWQHQKEELEIRNKCEEAKRDLMKKNREFESWYNKHMEKKTPTDEMDPHDKDQIAERRLVIEAAQSKIKEDEEAYQRQCIQVRDRSLMNLKTHLPQLFRALSDFSLACFDMYTYLKSLHR